MTKTNTQPKRVPELQEGSYSDGHPLHDVQYLQCKIILKPDRFISVASLHEFGDAVLRTAEELDIGFSRNDVAGQRPQIREIIFLDTECRRQGHGKQHREDHGGDDRDGELTIDDAG